MLFPSSTVCMLHSPPDTDTVSQCSTDEGSLGPTSEMAEALQELISAHVDCSLETTELDGQVCQVFKQCTHTACICPSKRGFISQTRRPVQPVRARQQFARRLLTQGYTRRAHAMIAGCTAVKIPPACRILYSNWHQHYAKDAYYKHRYRAVCAEPTKEGYVVQDPSSDRPFLRHQGKLCVPERIVDDVLRAVHSFAHP